jgi:hypothetical protein
MATLVTDLKHFDGDNEQDALKKTWEVIFFFFNTIATSTYSSFS